MNKNVIVIAGPTGTGKTALGVSLAKQLNTEVLSADSQLVYKGLNIGTAKPSLDERQNIPHHLMDMAEPNEDFSVAMYCEAAQSHMARLWQENKIPIVVGGTGFYIKSLLQPSIVPNVDPDPDYRLYLTSLAEQEGNAALHERLRLLDPIRAEAIHPNDRFRLIRALEINKVTGKPVPQEEIAKDISLLWLGLTYGDRQQHNLKLFERTQQMLDAGWLQEARDLVDTYGPDANALRVALGYSQLLQVLSGELSLEEAIELITIATRQYARRQLIWFRKNPDIHWLDVGVHSFEAQKIAAQAALENWLL
jgi:tRNA dimethylallyltransferase